MGKKKPFVDRKTASVYHVVRRSQRDVGTEDATSSSDQPPSDFVLMPSPENAVREAARQEEEGRRLDSAAAAAAAVSGKGKVAVVAADFDALKSHIERAGLLDNSARTYSKYTKPIQHGGAFVPAPSSGHLPTPDVENLGQLFTDTSKNDLDAALEEAMAVREADRMLDSIALNADCMEEDVAKALFDFEECEFEEILDDFCLTANQEQLEADDGGDGDGGDVGGGGSSNGGDFDYEKHIQMLMERARARDEGRDLGGRELGGEDDFFGGVKPLHGRIEEEDDNEDDDFDYDQYGEEEDQEDEDSLDREFGGNDSAKGPISDEQQRILCLKFEQALLEYDSDHVGDLDEECEDIVGDRPLEGDAQLEAALDEFLTEKQDEILFEGTTNKADRKKKSGGSGYSALVGGTMVNAKDLNLHETDALVVNIEESKRQMARDLAEADAFLANPEVDLPPEEVFIDGKSYFSISSRSQWDCESILSTYSNLDNNPAVIGRKKKKKGKKKDKGVMSELNNDVIPEEGPVQRIQLSNKTGLPMGTFDDLHRPGGDRPEEEEEYDDYYGEEGDTYLSVNRGEARPKSESKMEKKQRKVAIKEERKVCRMQKKMMKEAFGEEFQRRGQANVVDAVGGSTVFRFS